jgi:hypothetical protein
MDAVLTFLASPVVRYFGTLVVSFLMKRNPAIVTKAVPMLAIGLNAAVIALNNLFGLKPAEAGMLELGLTPAAALVGLSLTGWLGLLLFNPITEAVATVVGGSAVGTHSGLKNVLQWAQAGFGIFCKKDDSRGAARGL